MTSRSYRSTRSPDPVIGDSADAIVRITTSAICGTDLHFVRGTCPGYGPARFWATKRSAWWRKPDRRPRTSPPPWRAGRLRHELRHTMMPETVKTATQARQTEPGSGDQDRADRKTTVRSGLSKDLYPNGPWLLEPADRARLPWADLTAVRRCGPAPGACPRRTLRRSWRRTRAGHRARGWSPGPGR
jgi:hypothetical protein